MYGYPVILAWLRRGTILEKHCTDRGRPLHPSDMDREILEREFEERLDLALETVAEDLRFFRDGVLRAEWWSFEGGATLTTYFIGACLLVFPNVFLRWQADERRWHRALLSLPELAGTGHSALVDGDRQRIPRYGTDVSAHISQKEVL